MVFLVLVREGAASTKVVLWSRVVVRRGIIEGFCCLLLLGASGVDRGRVSGCASFGSSLSWTVSCSACRWLPACFGWWVSSPPGKVAEFLLLDLLFFVVFLVFSVEAFVLLSCWGPVPGSFACSHRRPGWAPVLSWPSSCSSFLWFVFEDLVSGVFVDVALVLYFCRFFLRYFTCCGVPARWRDLRHVFF